MTQRYGSPINDDPGTGALTGSSITLNDFHLDSPFSKSAAISGMQAHLFPKLGRLRRWRQYSNYLHFQDARYHTTSPRHQASKPFPKPKPSRSILPPTKPRKSRQIPHKVPQARQTDGTRWSGWRTRWHDWATEYRYFLYAIVLFASGITVFCSYSLQRVPITGRLQLDLIPHWVAVRIEKSERKKEEELREDLMKCSFGSDHPGMQGVNLIFNRLIRASGLDNRDWDFRVVLAPSE